MFFILYDFALCLISLWFFPKLLWQRLSIGKYKNVLRYKFGLSLPKSIKKDERPLFWFHAVSLGETKAASALIKALKADNPNTRIIISSITETGHAEALKIPEVEKAFYLPPDFSWIMKKLVKRLSPEVLIFVETDFWYNLIRQAKKHGAAVFLVNGKISRNSLEKFKRLAFFTKRIFSLFDVFCLQNEDYKERFLKLGIPEEKIQITGNLKFDQFPEILSFEEKKELSNRLGITDQTPVITIGSTHKGEEERILSALHDLRQKFPEVKILLVPRHPERFDEVEANLDSKNMQRFSKHQQITKPIVLIDQMGILSSLYQISTLAIVAGSFVPGIGGHNILEPLFFGVPSLYGAYMENQPELVKLTLNSQSGMQIKLSELSFSVEKLLTQPELYQTMSANAKQLIKNSQGSTSRTLDILL